MKTFTVFVLLAVSGLALARSFGGIQFHSRVPNDQYELLKQDIRYLFAVAPTANVELQELCELDAVLGAALHNFLVNRVRTIVPEDFSFQGPALLQKTDHVFPSTPLPENHSTSKSGINEEPNTARITMSNLGAGLYLGGKAHQLLLGVQVDAKKIFATSPRVGILQVGEGLFHSSMLLNPKADAAANSASRLSTLFHEARHSDGTGRSTGFVHALCPAGHALAGRPACDDAHNGSYRLGGVLERHLMGGCTSCSETERTMLAANVSDSFSRVLKATTTQEITQLKAVLENYIRTRDLYRDLLSGATGERVESIRSEIEKLTVKIREAEARIGQAQAQLAAAPEVRWDARPEGQFTKIPLSTSNGWMRGRP